jgi:hypothetical protein
MRLPRFVTILLGAIALVGAVIGIRALMPSGDQIATVRAETVPTLDKPMSGATQVRRDARRRAPLGASAPAVRDHVGPHGSCAHHPDQG